jgi:RNA polymerase sigma-70 factor (ECF subfamily)
VTKEEQNAVFELWANAHMAILHHAVNAFAQGDDRNDLMQEVLLAVWKSIPSFRGEAQPTTFIYRVSHNTAMTWRRKQNQSMPPVDLPGPNRTNPKLDQLYEVIQTFPPLDRSLLLLSLDEVSYREMAEIHGISESLAGVRLLRARTKLMEQMKEANHGSR